jgi:hypothetical protein
MADKRRPTHEEARMNVSIGDRVVAESRRAARPSRSGLVEDVPDLFRAVNERIRDFDPIRTDGQYDFVCECGDETCIQVMHMTSQEYETVHVEPRQFAVLPGHERVEQEDVVQRSARYYLVRAHVPLSAATPETV